MSDKNHEKKQHAQLLYISQGKSHAQIAEEVGVSERTIFNWVHQYAWDKLRLAAYQAPVSIADNLCSQIVELQQTIAVREPGQRFPTPQESMTMQRMVSCLEKMKKYPSLSQNMQILESFKNYIKPLDSDFAKDLGRYTNRYLSSAAQNSFVPYQVEYGIDAAPPLAPYYDDEEDYDILNVPRSQPDSPVTYNISGIHHARPYIIPLLNISRKQVMEEMYLAEQNENITADSTESRYNTANSTQASGSNPAIENDTIITPGLTTTNPIPLPVHPEVLHESGQSFDQEELGSNNASSGSNPEIIRNVTDSFSGQYFNQENQDSDEDLGSEKEEDLRMKIRQRWQTLFKYLAKEDDEEDHETMINKAS